jgi:dephospho-CoA kinase
MKQSENIYLVGLMGAGKTTIGRQLARTLKIPFYDSDKAIEERTGVDIPTIFEFEGEEGFRNREQKMIQQLTASKASSWRLGVVRSCVKKIVNYSVKMALSFICIVMLINFSSEHVVIHSDHY